MDAFIFKRMKLIVFLLFQYALAQEIKPGSNENGHRKILAWPAEWSHWINMKILLKKLANNGHEITVMRSSAFTDFILKEEEFQYFDFNVSGILPGYQLKSMDRILYATKLGKDTPSKLETAINTLNFWWEQLEVRHSQCHAILGNKKAMKILADLQFDAMLADASMPCGGLIAHNLKLPLIYSVRTLPGDAQFYFSQTPSPLAYVPMINTALSDQMSFVERVHNTINYVSQNILLRIYFKLFMDPIVSQYVGSNTTYADILASTNLWLIRTDFAFEYPRPLMPNVLFIGGFHCKPASVLEQPLKSISEHSKNHGFIVFSMGSMVRNMHSSKAIKFSSAFSKIKQQVFWRYIGDQPGNITNNTHILDWLPQNDLLGHKNCKLFITHGGTNGIYEAIYHGIPVLGIPLLVDQFDNMKRVTDNGMGITLDITKLTENDLLKAINTLIYDKSYKRNALRISVLHRDQAMHPLDSAIFRIEHTIRHNGANHLISASNRLSFFQYMLIDVILFLLAVPVLLALTISKLLSLKLSYKPK